jgi:hypothetical protein
MAKLNTTYLEVYFHQNLCDSGVIANPDLICSATLQSLCCTHKLAVLKRTITAHDINWKHHEQHPRKKERKKERKIDRKIERMRDRDLGYAVLSISHLTSGILAPPPFLC